MTNIRKQMLFFGVDLSHLSDEEIERRLVVAARTIASAGMPASDFVRGLQGFAEASKTFGCALAVEAISRKG